VTTIAQNLAAVRERIARAADRAGRDESEIKLIAVSKTIDAERIREAIAAGATDLGENYVQEALEKWQAIGPAARWHFIGHLQKNKVKYAVEAFDMIQSVDSIELAREIGKRALARGGAMDVLIEVNVAEEDSKFGSAPEKALELAEQVQEVEGIRLQGLMGMAPFLSDPEKVRPYFARLKGIWDRLPKEQRLWLSMGMSGDFEAAILEGSNMVRVGTAIFGERKARTDS
jgi:pyridoxal phosphate enzyme (YggS family)